MKNKFQSINVSDQSLLEFASCVFAFTYLDEFSKMNYSIGNEW